jgi:hypothetical protein
MLCFLLTLITPVAEAAGVSLVLRGHDLPKDKAVVVTFAAVPGASASVPATVAREMTLASAPVTMDLPPGSWTLDVAGEGVWHARQYLNVRAAPGGPVFVDLWRAATLTGSVNVERAELPSELGARFGPSKSGTDLPQGEVTCPVSKIDSEARFTCSLPAGSLDLRLRPRRYVARYFWGFPLEPGKVRDLGPVLFRRGSSVVGQVEIPPGARVDLAKVRVEAKPALTVDRRSHRLATVMPVSVSLEKGGLFHLDGVAPGAYEVVAKAGRLVSPPAVFHLGEGVEITLTKPLLIDEPHALTVKVTPAVAPSGRRWHINVSRDAGAAEGLDYVDGGDAGKEAGLWQSVGLYAGDYRVDLLDGADQWASETVSLGREPLTLPLTPTSRKIHGTVLLGDAPLAAELMIGDERARAVTLHSDEQGRFEGLLPSADTETKWTVTVKSEVPLLKRRFRLMTLEKSEEGGYQLSLHIPRSILFGTMVDEQGKPQSPGRVDIHGLSKQGESTLQPNVEADGTFAVHGLAPGRYGLQASSPAGESDHLEATIEEDGTSAPVTLVIHPVKIVRGRVSSEFGPIAGARVWVVPVDRVQVVNAHAPTEENGEFWASVPQGTRTVDISVSARGFGYKLLRTAVGDDPLPIVLDTRGGALAARGGDREHMPYLFHGGAMQSLFATAFEGDGGLVLDGQWVFTLPAAEPGAYAVCLLAYGESAPSAQQCVSAYLPPLGSLTIDASGIKAADIAPVSSSAP